MPRYSAAGRAGVELDHVDVGGALGQGLEQRVRLHRPRQQAGLDQRPRQQRRVQAGRLGPGRRQADQGRHVAQLVDLEVAFGVLLAEGLELQQVQAGLVRLRRARLLGMPQGLVPVARLRRPPRAVRRRRFGVRAERQPVVVQGQVGVRVAALGGAVPGEHRRAPFQPQQGPLLRRGQQLQHQRRGGEDVAAVDDQQPQPPLAQHLAPQRFGIGRPHPGLAQRLADVAVVGGGAAEQVQPLVEEAAALWPEPGAVVDDLGAGVAIAQVGELALRLPGRQPFRRLPQRRIDLDVPADLAELIGLGLQPAGHGRHQQQQGGQQRQGAAAEGPAPAADLLGHGGAVAPGGVVEEVQGGDRAGHHGEEGDGPGVDGAEQGEEAPEEQTPPAQRRADGGAGGLLVAQGTDGGAVVEPERQAAQDQQREIGHARHAQADPAVEIDPLEDEGRGEQHQELGVVPEDVGGGVEAQLRRQGQGMVMVRADQAGAATGQEHPQQGAAAVARRRLGVLGAPRPAGLDLDAQQIEADRQRPEEKPGVQVDPEGAQGRQQPQPSGRRGEAGARRQRPGPRQQEQGQGQEQVRHAHRLQEQPRAEDQDGEGDAQGRQPQRPARLAGRQQQQRRHGGDQQGLEDHHHGAAAGQRIQPEQQEAEQPRMVGPVAVGGEGEGVLAEVVAAVGQQAAGGDLLEEVAVDGRERRHEEREKEDESDEDGVEHGQSMGEADRIERFDDGGGGRSGLGLGGRGRRRGRRRRGHGVVGGHADRPEWALMGNENGGLRPR
jgi:hypothetical protein